MGYDAFRVALGQEGIFRLGETYGFIFGIFAFLLIDGLVALFYDKYTRYKEKKSKDVNHSNTYDKLYVILFS